MGPKKRQTMPELELAAALAAQSDPKDFENYG
jgi:hypothetical protein